MKKHYIILSILVLMYTFGVSILNVAVYGSILQWNLSILPLALVFPLYMGFKQHVYERKTVRIMWGYVLMVLLVTLWVWPKYTYQEALSHFDNPVKTLRRHVGEPSFFYKGSYYIKTEEGNFSFHINDGTTKGVEHEFK